MPRSRAGIALVQRPVNESIKKHRCGTREHHAHDNQNQNSQRRPAVCGHNERPESKWQRKNRVRKTNQSQKTNDWSASALSHKYRRRIFTEGSKENEDSNWAGYRRLRYLRFLLLKGSWIALRQGEALSQAPHGGAGLAGVHNYGQIKIPLAVDTAVVFKFELALVATNVIC